MDIYSLESPPAVYGMVSTPGLVNVSMATIVIFEDFFIVAYLTCRPLL